MGEREGFSIFAYPLPIAVGREGMAVVQIILLFAGENDELVV